MMTAECDELVPSAAPDKRPARRGGPPADADVVRRLAERREGGAAPLPAPWHDGLVEFMGPIDPGDD